MKIPWSMPYVGEEELKEVIDTVKSTWLTMGPRVKKFEEAVSNYLGVKYAIAVNSGTAALDVALKALDIQPGDEVIVPAMTYIATVNAVTYQGAKPVLADIEPKTYNLDPKDVMEKVTKKTKCIMPIDYGGQSTDYDPLIEIADDHNVLLVEDGAESLGGEYKGKKLCSFGILSTASFHAAKLITSVEGGMVFTNDASLEKKSRIIRNQGEDLDKKYHHTLLGHNYRMTDLHAAIGITQFRRLESVLRKRAEIAERYTNALKEFDDIIMLPYVAPENKHAWFFYTILVDNREDIVKYLKEQGIDTRIGWPLPVHQQPIYKKVFGNVKCPIAEKFAKGVLNLPMYYSMTKEEQDYIIKHLKDAISRFVDEKYELE